MLGLVIAGLVLLLALFPGLGCVHVHAPVQATSAKKDFQPTTQTSRLPTAEYDADLEAWVCPPPDWKPDPLKTSARHKHRVWVSPTGDSAYGVIRFRMPLPVPVELALVGFMAEMRRAEGEGRVLESKTDKILPGLRFVAEGGRYKIRTNLRVRGSGGWAVYAGSLRSRAENMAELVQAEQSREATTFVTGK